ncbi:helix-turn-helix domain-containing protein [Sulfurovum riftiae]|uniref:HTH cro/C1-type domain-containing protein n=1 Tax=Sulfurovum riftiae TaxID=1630136 RepID=A0A151CJ22_9BACT|nr:hypothetical protein [Sulfurovum riftiae]KYJ87526.1 hypothetical protein AS592_10490 [Sulfurovum riftiae]
MKFSEYLKKCREKSSFTQEQLVQELYLYDTGLFKTIETSTLSKWERGITKPYLSRQVGLIKYFQHKSGKALPCFDEYNAQEAQKLICKTGIQNLLGKSKKLIMRLPSKMIEVDDISITQLRNTEMIDHIIDMHMDIDQGLNSKFADFTSNRFKEFALHPSNSFFVCEHKDRFFGLLFTLRLKPEVFEKIMNIEIREKDLTVDDFASFHEVGCNYAISFFAMNEKAAALLFIRYYAHLIANQKSISEVGVSILMEDSQKLISNMNFHLHREKELDNGTTLQTYRETLANFLAYEKVVKIILDKQECPEG